MKNIKLFRIFRDSNWSEDKVAALNLILRREIIVSDEIFEKTKQLRDKVTNYWETHCKPMENDSLLLQAINVHLKKIEVNNEEH